MRACVTLLFLAAALGAQESDAPKKADPSRVQWVRPYKEAAKAAQRANRLMVLKPIYGGTNTPKEGGKLGGGKNDCEGSW